MFTTSSIISLAFCVGVILGYDMLKKIIRDVLGKKRDEVYKLDKETRSLVEGLMSHLGSLMRQCDNMKLEADNLLKNTHSKANHIIESSEQQMNSLLDLNDSFHMKQVSDKVAKAVEDLKASSADIAADTVKKVMRKYKNRTNGEVILSVSRKLNDKLH